MAKACLKAGAYKVDPETEANTFVVTLVIITHLCCLIYSLLGFHVAMPIDQDTLQSSCFHSSQIVACIIITIF